MKRLLFSVGAMALFCLWLVPTETSATEIRGGIKAGLNIANVHGADVTSEFLFDTSTDSRLGLVGGVFVCFNLSTNFAIQAEALYSVKGAKVSIPDDWEITATLGYLEIPILAKYIIPYRGSVKPCLFVGPALAFNVTHKFKSRDNGTPNEGNLEGIKSTDLGLALGGGVDIGRNLRADVRYTLGLAKIAAIGGVTFDIKNGAFSAMVGYCF